MSELSDEQIDAIWEDATEAARDAWGPAGLHSRRNPHPFDSDAAEIWACAFRNAYAHENGY
jgi:hypothetical protein